MIYAIVVLFVASSFLLFLPIGTSTPQPSGPPPLNEIPEAFGQENAVPPNQAVPAEPAAGGAQPNPAVPGAATQGNPLQAAPAP